MPEKQSQATVEVLAESVGGLVTRKYLDERLEILKGELDVRFDGIDARFKSIDARFESVDARFKSVDARFEKLEATIEKKFASHTIQFLLIQIGLFGLLLTALAYFTQPLRAEPAAPANTEIIAHFAEAPVQFGGQKLFGYKIFHGVVHDFDYGAVQGGNRR